MQASMRRYALLALGALALIWGYNWVVMKIATQYASPFEFAAWRLLGGALLLFVAMTALRKPLMPERPAAYVWIGLFQSGAFVGLATWAVVMAGAGKVAVLSYTMPFWVAALGWPLLGERLRPLQIGAIAAALCGIVLIVDVGHTGGSLGPDAIAVAAGVAWAIGVVMTRRVQVRHKVDPLWLTTWQLFFGGLGIGIVAAIVPHRATHWTPLYAAALAYNIVLASACAYLLWVFVLRKLPARDASMGTLANPIIGILAAWLQLGEVPSMPEAIGMALIVLSLLALTLQQQ
jgi:drug/metabolite transporter (DMT)-like permease